MKRCNPDLPFRFHSFRFSLRHFPMALLLASLLPVLAGCGRAPDATALASTRELPFVLQADGHVRVPASSPLRHSLSVAVAATAHVGSARELPAQVAVDPSRLVKVVLPLGGRIVRMHRTQDQSVRRGDALVAVDSPEYGKAQAAYLRARKQLARTRELAAADIVSRRELEEAEAEEAAARDDAEPTGGVATLRRLGAREYLLTSPIDGQVVDAQGAVGAYWSDTAAPVLSVADLSQVWLLGDAQEQDLAAIAIGDSVDAALAAWPGREFRGEVVSIGGVLDVQTRTVKVRAVFDNADGALKPGMFARVRLQGRERRVTTVPAAALVQRGAETIVWRESVEWEFEPRVVEVGEIRDGIAVLASGLAAGERVLAGNGVLFHD